MTPKEILERIPGLTRDQLAYYAKSYVHPQRIQRGKNEYAEYSEDDFVVIQNACYQIHTFGTSPKHAFAKAKVALSEPEFTFNRRGETPMSTDRSRLLSILKDKSVSYGNFALSSGNTSNYYIDAKETTYNAEGVYLTGKLIFDLIQKENNGISAVGGLTMGADPIAVSTIIAAMNAGYQLNGFSVRKDQKLHGQKKLIEGNLTKGEKVVIIDDVITTGNSTIKAIDAVEKYGCEIVLVVALVDRGEGGVDKIREKGLEFTSLFKIRDVVKSEALKGVKLNGIAEDRDHSVDAEGILQEEYT